LLRGKGLFGLRRVLTVNGNVKKDIGVLDIESSVLTARVSAIHDSIEFHLREK
jgi:hypothetical protein